MLYYKNIHRVKDIKYNNSCWMKLTATNLGQRITIHFYFTFYFCNRSITYAFSLPVRIHVLYGSETIGSECTHSRTRCSKQ